MRIMNLTAIWARLQLCINFFAIRMRAGYVIIIAMAIALWKLTPSSPPVKIRPIGTGVFGTFMAQEMENVDSLEDCTKLVF